jgi:hypothetical protein
VVLDVTAAHIARIVVFADPALFGRFGLPPVWADTGPQATTAT